MLPATANLAHRFATPAQPIPHARDATTAKIVSFLVPTAFATSLEVSMMTAPALSVLLATTVALLALEEPPVNVCPAKLQSTDI